MSERRGRPGPAVAVAGLAAVVLAALLLVPWADRHGAPARALPGSPLLVLHGGPSGSSPEQLARRAGDVDASPFDGITVELPGVSGEVLTGQPVGRDAVALALRPMPDLPRPRHDLVVLRAASARYDPADVSMWQTVDANTRHFAAALRDDGRFAGVFLDTEHYGTPPTPWAVRDPQVLDGLVQRAAQVARALAAEWPGTVLLTTYGPWVGDPRTAAEGFLGLSYDDVSDSNRGMAAFAAGLALGSADAGLQYVDGGELYRLRTPADFAQAYRWRKTGLAGAGGPVLPAELADRWPATVSVGFGLYDEDLRSATGGTLPARTWEAVVTAALRTTDRWVWTYSDRYSWLGTRGDRPRPPQGLVDATARARRAGSR